MVSGNRYCPAPCRDKAAHPRGAAVTGVTGGDVASAVSTVTVW
jgi:hypothetical protein